ncbi:MAG: bifunctional folylpolyglutamate synthase/dihydrofolate synthase [Flavobacteriales bacterium]|nr:MAG: bifunctional folylpolyglutamate synthase/dihydrofolate synthase [Flavobacteriales bacterium]
MNYQQTLDYLFSQLPMFQRVGASAYKADLNNTIELCKLLHHPEKNFKSIHIAGTNGKGSTSHMLASILQEAGYKVGLYTSPHLKDFRERIKINGVMISEQEVVDFVIKHQSEFEQINLSFFEWTVGLAFDYFSKKQVDIAVIETGLGGRLDSTNVITPLVSVITNIGKDHTQFLGETLAKIASEKAGIIKENIPIIIGETQQETQQVFIDKALEKSAKIFFADKIITTNYESDLKGIYQEKNKKTVLAAIQQLMINGFSIAEENIKNGLLNVVKNTGLLGRWQILSENPLTICDTGHNEAGIKEVLKQISLTKHNHLHFVFGAVNDKEIDSIISMLPKNATYYFCQAKIPRALDVNNLYTKAKEFELKGNPYDSVENAIKQAKANASVNDLVFVGGSTFVVAEAI